MTLRPNHLVLFQGDSITNAFRRPEEVGTSYRMGAGYAMIIAAALQALRPADALRFENRGISGNGLEDLQARWEQDTLALRPDVLSILVGVNGTLRTMKGTAGERPTEFQKRYQDLLAHTLERLPAVRLVLCEPFLLCTGAVTPAYLEHLRPRQEAVREVAQKAGAAFVPLQAELDRAAATTGAAYWLFDGIHPNAPAQWLIAKAWLQATGLADALEGKLTASAAPALMQGA